MNILDDVWFKDGDPLVAMNYAVFDDDVSAPVVASAVERALQMGFDVEAELKTGNTALFELCSRAGRAEAIALLLESGADALTPQAWGMSPAVQAIYSASFGEYLGLIGPHLLKDDVACLEFAKSVYDLNDASMREAVVRSGVTDRLSGDQWVELMDSLVSASRWGGVLAVLSEGRVDPSSINVIEVLEGAVESWRDGAYELTSFLVREIEACRKFVLDRHDELLRAAVCDDIRRVISGQRAKLTLDDVFSGAKALKSGVVSPRSLI